MTVFVNPKVWISGETITAAKLNTLGAYLQTLFNVTKLSGSNLLNATVAPANLINPKAWVCFNLVVQPPGVGTGWTPAAQFDGYTTDLDFVKAPANMVVVSASARVMTDTIAPGQAVQLWHMDSFGGTAAIAGANMVLSLAGEVSTPVLNYTVGSQEQLMVRMDNCTSFAQLPVKVCVWAVLVHTS